MLGDEKKKQNMFLKQFLSCKGENRNNIPRQNDVIKSDK